MSATTYYAIFMRGESIRFPGFVSYHCVGGACDGPRLPTLTELYAEGNAGFARHLRGLQQEPDHWQYGVTGVTPLADKGEFEHFMSGRQYNKRDNYFTVTTTRALAAVQRPTQLCRLFARISKRLNRTVVVFFLAGPRTRPWFVLIILQRLGRVVPVLHVVSRVVGLFGKQLAQKLAGCAAARRVERADALAAHLIVERGPRGWYREALRCGALSDRRADARKIGIRKAARKRAFSSVWRIDVKLDAHCGRC